MKNSHPHIVLDQFEMASAAAAGCRRNIDNIEAKRTPRKGCARDRLWQFHVEGCMGEVAVAKFLNVYWRGVGGIGDPDTWLDQVRTRSEHDYDLFVEQKDDSDSVFWLVTGSYGDYYLRGWIWGSEAKEIAPATDKFNTGSTPAHWVSTKHLHLPQEYLDSQLHLRSSPSVVRPATVSSSW